MNLLVKSAAVVSREAQHYSTGKCEAEHGNRSVLKKKEKETLKVSIFDFTSQGTTVKVRDYFMRVRPVPPILCGFIEQLSERLLYTRFCSLYIMLHRAVFTLKTSVTVL